MAAKREARQRGVQLIDAPEVEQHYQSLDNSVSGSVNRLLDYLADSPRTRSSSIPSLRPVPPSIAGAMSVDNRYCHPNRSGNYGCEMSIIESALSRKCTSQGSNIGEEIQIRLVPSLTAPEWEPTLVHREATGRIQCENISAQGCANSDALARRDRRLEFSLERGTATLEVLTDSADVIEHLCSIFISECLGGRNLDLESIIRTQPSGKPQKLYEALD